MYGLLYCLAILLPEASAKALVTVPNLSHTPSQRLDTHIQNRTCPNANSPILSLWQEQNSLCSSAVEHIETSSNNSTSSINIHHPWIAEAECLEHFPSEQEFCIYTTTSFAGARGLSLFLTPAIASLISSLSSFTYLPESTPTSAPFRETSLPGRGKGLIAEREIAQGELILSSTPILIIDEEIFDLFKDQQRFPFQSKAVDSLPPRTKKLFYDLAGQFGGDRVEDRIKTNTFSAIFGERKHGVVVPEPARLNHDCRPNARFAFDPETLTHKVHALRDIEEGEELTISYIDEKLLSPARQSHLHSHWNFTCNCAACTLPSALLAASNARLAALAKLRTQLLDFNAGSPTTPQMARTFIELNEEEGLHAALPEAYMLAAIRSCMWEDPGQTREYAKEAVRRWMVWEKKGMENRESLIRIAMAPMGGWCWGLARMEGVGNRDL